MTKPPKCMHILCMMYEYTIRIVFNFHSAVTLCGGLFYSVFPFSIILYTRKCTCKCECNVLEEVKEKEKGCEREREWEMHGQCVTMCCVTWNNFNAIVLFCNVDDAINVLRHIWSHSHQTNAMQRMFRSTVRCIIMELYPSCTIWWLVISSR